MHNANLENDWKRYEFQVEIRYSRMSFIITDDMENSRYTRTVINELTNASWKYTTSKLAMHARISNYTRGIIHVIYAFNFSPGISTSANNALVYSPSAWNLIKIFHEPI